MVNSSNEYFISFDLYQIRYAHHSSINESICENTMGEFHMEEEWHIIQWHTTLTSTLQSGLILI